MSFKPEVFTTDVVVQQVQELQKRKNELVLQADQVAKKLEKVHLLMSENETLAVSSKEFLHESVDLFLDEWKKTEKCYPEIRLHIIEKALELAAPDAEKKPAAPPAGGAAAPKK